MVDEREFVRESIYHIRVQGYLDERWADWFEGFVMTSRDNGETLLTGAVVDQAALHGVLGKIRGLGLPLLLLAQAGCPCTNRNCPRALSSMRRPLWRQRETAFLPQGKDQVGQTVHGVHRAKVKGKSQLPPPEVVACSVAPGRCDLTDLTKQNV